MSKSVRDVLSEQDLVTTIEWSTMVALRAVASFYGASERQAIDRIIEVIEESPKAGAMAVYAAFLSADLMRSGITESQIEERCMDHAAKAKKPALMSDLLALVAKKRQL